MATCLKRSSKPPAVFVEQPAESLESGGSASSSSGVSGPPRRRRKLRELACPICCALLREPVTLPCAHNLCLRCLRGTVEHSGLACPLCRQRVGSWLRSATKSESLVNQQLWQFIRENYQQELDGQELLDFDDDFTPNKSISADGEIRKEYELQLQLQEDEMRRQREKERLVSEAFIRKLQEEEEQKNMLQLAQDQLLAKTLAKQEIVEKANDKPERSSKSSTVSNPKLNNQSKTTSHKAPAKTKDTGDAKKQNVALISKIRSERYAAKHSLTSVQKDSSDTCSSQKPVPIHNAVTRVVTQQCRSSQSSDPSCSAAPDELISSSSKIYGQQSEEELHVPNDVLSNKKKKLGVEVCMTTNVEDEERGGSAESAGSHDSMNQEFHHFKPIKALPRTPFRTSDGKQIDPKLIRVLPILKRVSNAVPKPPTPTHTKKMFGCTWSAFKRIAKMQLLLKDSPSQPEIKKTDRKVEQSSRNTSNKTLSATELELTERSSADGSNAVAFDSNKNYTGRVINGAKLSKNEHTVDSAKHPGKRGKLRNGSLPSAHRKKEPEPQKEIEVVQIDDDEEVDVMDCARQKQRTPDPLGPSPSKSATFQPNLSSPMLELAVENIAERIKRRKTSRTAAVTSSGDAENEQSTINLGQPVEQTVKLKSKKTSTKGRKQKTKKSTADSAPPKQVKTSIKRKKIVVTTTVTSQIKRLAAKSSKRPRYTEDSESEEEPEPDLSQAVATSVGTTNKVEQPAPPAPPSPPPPLVEANDKVTELEQPSSLPNPPAPRKRPRKNAKPTPRKQPKPATPSPDSSLNLDDEALVKEQERLERLAEQERQDRELAQQLQARFNAMERVAGRTRRGIARLPAGSPPLADIVVEQSKRPPQKRPAVK